MSKTFGTKNRIIKLLKEKPMTITEISEVLGLSKATVSQHMSELESMSMIEQVDNSHFKKVKFYKLPNAGSHVIEQKNGGARFRGIVLPLILAIAVVAVLAAAILQNSGTQVRILPAENVTPVASTAPIGEACPMIIAFTNGTHANESLLNSIVSGIASGSQCSLAYLSGNRIGNLNYTSSNGTVYVPELRYRYTINQTNIANLKAAVDEGFCGDLKALAFFGINYTEPAGLVCKASIYS
ncbi:winged helix-turn-helix domain-containing protein [Candidatus Marsarchaeota archaeon]|nr:winged helix-turn-helix domain-containing protein [Candidatus Marsarchaeota archaeon]MCL5404715.1 winged helix-turn-helix domain-containing protein [Candidatus Marsarchaeota archaeon]